MHGQNLIFRLQAEIWLLILFCFPSQYKIGITLLSYNFTRIYTTGLKKKNLNSRLSFGQAAPTFCCTGSLLAHLS